MSRGYPNAGLGSRHDCKVRRVQDVAVAFYLHSIGFHNSINP